MLKTKLIKTKLIQQDKKQKELAEFVGIAPSVLSGYVNNKRKTPALLLFEIAQFLNCPMEELVSREVA